MLDPRVIDSLTKNAKDVTADKDVSGIIEEFDEMSPVDTVSTIDDGNEIGDDAIIIYSMDGITYAIDRNTLDFETLIANIGDMYGNLLAVKNMLSKSIFSSCVEREGTEDDITSILETITEFVTGFGLKPKYEDAYPGISKRDMIMCYCTDAIEILNAVIREAMIYQNEQVKNDLFNTFKDLFKEEIENDGNQVSADNE